MKRLLARMDKSLLFFTILMFLFGLLMIFSASSVHAALVGNAYSIFIKQFFALIICFIVSLFIVVTPTAKYQRYIYIYLYIIMASLIFVFAKGLAINGVKGWIDTGFFSIQPSEFGKTALIILMGIYYAKHYQKETRFAIYKPFIYVGIILVLTYLQPDFGTMLIILMITGLIFLSLPIDSKWKRQAVLLILSLGILVAGVLLMVKAPLFTDAQLRRFTYQNPCSRYQEPTGYQVCNGYIAMKNGGLLGVGLGNSTQKYLYLPAAYTDFIFPIIVEELGLVGGFAIIAVYILILWRIFKIARRSSKLSGSIIAYGTAMYLMLHIFVNLTGILALFPLTGVPLPFLSYGGSYALNLSIMLAIVQRIEIENKLLIEKKALHGEEF